MIMIIITIAIIMIIIIWSMPSSPTSWANIIIVKHCNPNEMYHAILVILQEHPLQHPSPFGATIVTANILALNNHKTRVNTNINNSHYTHFMRHNSGAENYTLPILLGHQDIPMEMCLFFCRGHDDHGCSCNHCAVSSIVPVWVRACVCVCMHVCVAAGESIYMFVIF